MVSIIVTHKKSLFYLRDCLESIALQEFKDYETILVIDHTEDDMTEIINEFQDIVNLKVYHLEGATGVSAARNLGIEKAQGDYIYFLDNDDYILGDAIGLLMSVVEKDTDIAYGKFKHTWFQRLAFNEKQQEEEEEEPDPSDPMLRFDFENPFQFRFERYRKLEKVTVLSSLYRKGLFTENNIRFDEDQTFFADLKVAVMLMKVAKNFKCHEESIYVKRHHNDKQNNPALVQYTKEETMPDYIQAYHRAYEVVKDNQELKDHLNVILAKFICKEYIKKIRYMKDNRWKGEFFKELVNASKNIDIKKVRKELKRREVRLVKAVKSGDYDKTYKAVTKILIYRKAKRMFTDKNFLYKTITLYVFNRMSLKENWIVFESFMGRNCSGQPKYIYKYLQENYGNKYKYIWVVDRKGVNIPGKHTKCKRLGLKYFYYMNRSKYWVTNMRQPLSIPRREETILLSTWHGTPLKRLVFDMDDVHSANPKYKETVFKQTRGWDYLISDNPFSTDTFQSCFLFDREKIIETGYPANDPMYAPNREELANKIRKKLSIPENKKVILYAPTWRDDQFYDKGQYGFDLDLDINRLKKEFGEEYVLLLRLHYFIVDQLDLSQYGDFTRDGSSYDDITDLYLISDILITDYSSVFFDYANLKRPILYYTYDIEKYRDVLRGFYLDMEKDLPGPLLLTNDDVVDAIKNIEQIAEQYKDRYEEFYNRFCCVDDGFASKRVVEKVFK